ncbi:MAG: class I SAM-dependent methyltransferase, partial [Planctomycetota bacterium]
MSKTSWDSLAPCFEQNVMQIAEHDLDSTLENEIRRIAKGRRLAADLGCGIGSLLPLLCENFSTVYAIDFSPALLNEAKNRLSCPNVHFIQHNLAGDKRLPVAADVTFCVNALITDRPSN